MAATPYDTEPRRWESLWQEYDVLITSGFRRELETTSTADSPMAVNLNPRLNWY
jgi:hypothetical protein